MMKYLKYIVCLIVLFPVCVKGAICSNSEKIRLQKMAQNITTNYEYVESNGSVVFSINFYNLNSELYIVDTRNNKNYYYTGDVLTLGGFASNTNYKFEIRSTNVLCDSSSYYHIYIALPAYNPYYNDPVCSGVKYKYCNKWYNNNLSYDEFVKEVENYKNSQGKTIDEHPIVKGIFDIILEFYIKNYYILLPSLIVVSLVFIAIKAFIDKKKNSLF